MFSFNLFGKCKISDLLPLSAFSCDELGVNNLVHIPVAGQPILLQNNLKGLVHPKIKILSGISDPHVVPTP